MKFHAKVYYKIDRHCEQWWLGVRLTPLAVTCSIFMKKKNKYPQSVNT